MASEEPSQSGGTGTTSTNSAQQQKDRASARHQVAQQWASRRQEKASKQQQGAPSAAAAQTKPPPAPRPTALVPSLCHAIGKAWQDILSNITNSLQQQQQQQQQQSGSAQPKIKSQAPGKGGRNASKNSAANKPKGKTSIGSFPSVLQILQASALHEQVSQFQDTNQQQSEDNNNEEALRVLPAGYDWNQAIWKMAESRSRAFLLLDLAVIVPVLVQWKRQRPSPKIEFLYTVQYNADPKLLQLLLRSQVGLVCTNKWDLTKCRQAVTQLHNTTDSKRTSVSCIYDNSSQTGKPDGFLRQLVLGDKNQGGVDTIVVDGPEEVQRIVAAIQRLQKRRRQQPQDQQQQQQDLYFLLRLPDGESTNTWNELVQSTQHAIDEATETREGQTGLIGISIDVSACSTESYAVLSQTLGTLLDTVEAGYNTSMGPGVRLDLTGVDMPPTKDTILLWKTLSERPNLSHITVDVSQALVSPAGALCTRIIGVKEEHAKTDDKSCPPKDDDNNTKSNIRHYYIDDGCYGSLYNASEHKAISNPLPLGVDHNSDSHENNGNTYTSTVWGPTCDGLDRVCRDIPLPKLHRDQWLVFPNLGCRIGEGMGTAFNGFSPPDTVYCVLGYWGQK